MSDISNEDEKYLARDNVVKREFKLKGQDVLTSADRLFIKNKNNVRYIEFTDISSIELSVQRQWLVIGLGLVLIACTLNLQQMAPPNWAANSLPGKLLWGYDDGGSVYIIIGAILTLIGFFWKTLSIKFKLSGLCDEFALSGDKRTVNALFELVNEQRSQNPAKSVQ
jgi:hypothetical protein